MKITAGDYDQTADERVAHWLVAQFRAGRLDAELGQREARTHLVACQELEVEFEGFNSAYGCETGCEYARLEATITCPHWMPGEPLHPTVDVEYGEFGDLPDLMEKIFG